MHPIYFFQVEGVKQAWEDSMIRVKRVYEPPERSDGLRILADRLWPRGLSREHAAVDLWLKDLAPSERLRKWFGHDPARWTQFKEKYRRELGNHAARLEQIAAMGRENNVTLLYAARDTDHNDAVALHEYLTAMALPKSARGT
jgi:uncharacterized protein YeaO (DUF488 family)